MNAIDRPEPDPEFVRHLEWQLRSELRRRERFHAARGPFRPPLVVAALFAALAIGFAGATAAQEYGSRARLRYQRMQAESAVELTRMRMDYAREVLDEMVAAGEDEEAIASMRWELGRVRFELLRGRLQLEEVSASGEAARHDLTAPRVAGRDFVSEHLELERQRLLLDADRLSRVIAERDDADTVRALEMEVARLREEIATVDGELELRERFFVDARGAEEILRQQRVARGAAQLRAAEERVVTIEQYLASVRARLERGEAERMELRAAEFELAQARIDARLARAQLEMASDVER